MSTMEIANPTEVKSDAERKQLLVIRRKFEGMPAS